jgi:hypothetical protein
MKMLSSRQMQILESLVNRIIPADEYVGGWEAGVGDYLLRQFERDLKHLVQVYAVGLDALDEEARALHSRNFDELDESLQDDLLTQIEVGRVAASWVVDPIAFFHMAVEHCAEGYYSDPGNGGNKGGVSWDMINFQVNG